MRSGGVTPPAVAFVGYSGSGKTTFLVRVVTLLTDRGLSVGVIKHAPRHVSGSDRRATKDSDRFWEIGAAHVALVASDYVVHKWRSVVPPPVEEVVSSMSQVDLVLVEGFKQSSLPKVEIVRAACHPALLPGLSARVALVTDVVGLECDVPRFSFDQPGAVVEFLVCRFLPQCKELT